MLRKIDELVNSKKIFLRLIQLNFIRETYEEIISTFPSNGRFWKAYIEHEMRMGNYEKTEKLFQRCLIKVRKNILNVLFVDILNFINFWLWS